MQAVCEREMAQILRTERMIDLYRVLRDAVRIGEKSYSIKRLERLCMGRRKTAHLW